MYARTKKGEQDTYEGNMVFNTLFLLYWLYCLGFMLMQFCWSFFCFGVWSKTRFLTYQASQNLNFHADVVVLSTLLLEQTCLETQDMMHPKRSYAA